MKPNMNKLSNCPECGKRISGAAVFCSQCGIKVKGNKPENLCDSAWKSMEKFVKELACGGGNFFDGWMRNEHSAMISCNDGFRPVTFYLETIE